MKQLLILLAFVFAAFFAVNNFLDAQFSNAPSEIGRIAESASLSAKIVALAAREPETKIQVPVENVKKRLIADTFGAPRGNDRQHQGQDIFARRGTPIRSATEGYVVKIGESNLGGKTIFVAGAGQRYYYYAHLNGFAENLQVGDFVTPETVIGFVGDTGNAKGTPTHLHFGIYTANGAINPLPLFAD